MEQGCIGAGKLTGAVWAAVLSPAVGILPALAARFGGQGGWLAPLVVLPALLLLTRVWGRLAQRKDRMDGAAGRLLTIIYIMWALVLACARLRLSGQRLQFTAQRETRLWFFLPILAAAAAWLAWGKADAFVRAAAVFGRVLTLTLGAVVGLTLFQIRPENLFPLWTGDILPVLRAAVPTLGVLCCGVYGAFLWGGGQAEGVKRRVSGGCVALALLLLSVLGNMGAELAAALEDPFLTLSKHVGVEGAFQRVESLVSTLWLLGDLALLGLLLWACRQMMHGLAPRWRGRWVAAAGAAAILLGTGLIFRDAILAQRFEYTLAPLGNLVLGGAVPCALYLLEKRKGD